ncbi:MAG: phospholipase D-like domain-containing protein [Acidobacteriota bacterium]
MASVVKTNGSFSVRAYRGDAKTLLAFNLDKKQAKNLAGFTIQCTPEGQPPYYLHNSLQYKTPAAHAQDAAEPAISSINAPFHKFRWLHVPGSVHQGTKPFLGKYTYTVTPRYIDAAKSLQPLDSALGVSLRVDVLPFTAKKLEVGFTRGFTQSQAFVQHFGLKALIRPKGNELLFDTAVESGVNVHGDHYTFEDQYEWLGFTARARIFELLNAVIADKTLRLDVFAYDLNEPDLMTLVLTLAGQKRVRVILDNAALHHDATTPKPEDKFESLFRAKSPDGLLRGKFGRYAHDKVFIVYDATGPARVLTGSTNFSVTGLYVNSNHVLVFNDRDVAAAYAAVFASAWNDKAANAKFQKSAAAGKVFSFSSRATPATNVTFSPHTESFATTLLQEVADRITREGQKTSGGSVLFAVMDVATGSGPIYPALTALHEAQNIFSYGISDNPSGIFLYEPGKKTGVVVTGRPVSTQLPPPFNQVPGVGIGHQVHHKFVVCGFNSDEPVVYCGSSNLALAGEQVNGDNLIAIRDADVAAAFAIEALGLVDHFNFLNRYATAPNAPKNAKDKPPASKAQAAAQAGWFLSVSDGWTKPYFEPGDLRCVDRGLFA